MRTREKRTENSGEVLRVAVVSREYRPGIAESLKRFGAVFWKVERDLRESLGAWSSYWITNDGSRTAEMPVKERGGERGE